MQIEIHADEFRDALGKILTVVDKKISRPLLTNCLLKATPDNRMEIQATDLEVSAKVALNCNVEKPGQLCINTKNIFDIVRELPSANVSMSVDESDNLLKLSCQNVNYSLVTVSAQDYPVLTFTNEANSFDLSSEKVQFLISKISHAISHDETRLFLNGIFLQSSDSALRAVAVDGYRLALVDIVDFPTSSGPLVDGIIIPEKGVYELKKLADSFPDKEIKLSVDDSFIYASAADSYFLSVRLIAREFPKYQAHIPNKTAYSFTIDKNQFLDAVKRIRILANEKTNGVKIFIDSEELQISANHAVYGDAVEKLAIDYTGESLGIGFNAKYLMDTISVLPDGPIVFEFNNELSPILVKSDDMQEFLGIIMPLKL